MKKIIPFMVVLIIAAGATTLFITRSTTGSNPRNMINNQVVDPNSIDKNSPDGNDVYYVEEEDDASIKIVPSKTSNFFGTWTTTSDKAQFLYGDIVVEIKEDGTWKGSITGEPLSGTWDNKGDHLRLNNDLFSFSLAFTDTGTLLFIDDEAEDVINLVLSRKK